MENTLAVSCKIKCILTIWPSNWTTEYLSQKSENICPLQNLCIDLHSSSICNRAKLEMTRVFFSDNFKQTMIHPYSGMCTCACCAQSLSCVQPCNPMDCSPPGSSVHGIFQARILEWVGISYSRGSSWPRDGTCTSCLAGGFFTAETPAKPTTLLSNKKKKPEYWYMQQFTWISRVVWGVKEISQVVCLRILYNILKNSCGILKVKKED